MFLGTRKIRSAGRDSGSIEITLPPELAALEGVNCRMLVRDGARPEIVLEPDLSGALAVFRRIWERLRSLMGLSGDIGEFPVQEFEIVLFPAPRLNGRPALIYSQALLATQPAGHGQRAALVGIVAALAAVAGARLGLTPPVAASFGDALAELVGESVLALADLEQGAVRQAWQNLCGAGALPLNVLYPHPNDAAARQALQRVVSQFRRWQEHPDQHELARARFGVYLSKE
jgi:hypothetical protein